MRRIVLVHFHRHALLLAGRERNFLPSHQALGRLVRAGRQRQVNLCHFGARHGARVLQVERHLYVGIARAQVIH